MLKTTLTARPIAVAMTFCFAAPLPSICNAQQPPSSESVAAGPVAASRLSSTVVEPARVDTSTPPAVGCTSCGPARWFGFRKPGKVHHHDTVVVPPFGVSVRAALNAQIGSGLAAQMVLYAYDFRNEDLTLTGRRRALRITEFMRMASAPIVIEASGNADLDEARRQNVAAFLQQTVGLADGLQAIVIDKPAAAGLSGDESRIIYEQLLLQTQSGGANYLNSNSGGSAANPIDSINAAPFIAR